MTPDKATVKSTWNTASLHQHLQGVVDLEMWTIPYYLTVLYSITDPTSDAYRLVQAAVYEEMLHTQLASNIANAYGLSPTFKAPVYVGDAIPHIDFKLDVPNPTTLFHPYCADLGPLDEERINTMCLIEYPEWRTAREPDVRANQDEYGSIAEFYEAVRVGMTELRATVCGGRNQVDQFGSFYQGQPDLTITADGEDGFKQAITLVDMILAQGEGQTQAITQVPVEFQNTADGFQDDWPHFQKFDFIRRSAKRPEVYTGVRHPDAGTPGHRAQQVLIRDFALFLETLTALFSGRVPSRPAFGAQMAKLGGDVLTCWQQQAIPRFS